MTDVRSTIVGAAALLGALVALPSGASAQATTLEGSTRHLTPNRPESLNDAGRTLQQRVIDLGFYSWPAVLEKVDADQVNRPRKVADCGGHHPDYRPAHDFRASEDYLASSIGQTRAFIYEWYAYRNAITNRDCSCASLLGDWQLSMTQTAEILEGFSNPRMFTQFPNKAWVGIKNEYDRMCDVRLNLNFG